MKLEDQVVSLELAKRLKELGVKQESLWYWYHPAIDPEDVDLVLNSRGRVLVGDFAETQTRLSGYEIKDKFSAFTVAELGEMLPQMARSGKTTSKSYTCQVLPEYIGGVSKMPLEHADTEADARAKMLIYLIENNLINPTH